MKRKWAGAAGLDAALTSLPGLDLAGLRARWKALTGRAAPPTFRAPLLRAAVAYKLQERVHGGLKPSTRRLLHRVADAAERSAPGSERDATVPRHGGAITVGLPHGAPDQAHDGGPTLSRAASRAALPSGEFLTGVPDAVASAEASPRAATRRRGPQAPTRIKPGTRLLRTWQGSTHEVLVGDTGVTYRGQPYRSLSEVARIITGQRWSGPLFFGLKRRTPSDLEPVARPGPGLGRSKGKGTLGHD